MTRLHINLSKRQDDYLVAASRMHDVMTVDKSENPDAFITDDNKFQFEEKPVLLINASPAHKKPWLFPAFPWRFTPDVQVIVESLQSGKLGKPGLIRMHHWLPGSDSQKNASKIAAVDLACWLFDKSPDSVFGTSNDTDSKECSLIHLGFPEGGMAMLDFANNLHGDYHSLCLIGSQGAAYADDHRNLNLCFVEGVQEASTPNSNEAFIKPMLEDFVNSVREAKSSGNALQNYHRAMEIVTTATTPHTDS